MNAARDHITAARQSLPVSADVALVPREHGEAANDATAAEPRVHRFSVDGDPLAGMAIASVILFALFAGLMATF